MSPKKNNYGHGPCPSCPSHDAFFTYKDGHGHCFSCGYHDHGTRTIASMKKKLEPPEMVVSEGVIKLDGYLPDLPKVALNWLKKYDISNYEITKYGLMWNERGQSLAFPLKDRFGRIFATNERYFGEKVDHPKYLTKGNKTAYPAIYGDAEMKIVILVEDVVSAIKVGRRYTGVPLLGTTVPMSWINNYTVPDKGHRIDARAVTIWLDPDKKQESLFQWARVSQYQPKARVIFSDKDPKYYSDKEIKKIVEGTI